MREFGLQESSAVARRAFCLGAFIRRGQSEFELRHLERLPASDETRQQITTGHHDFAARLIRWLDDEKLTPYLAASERRLLQRPPGSWDQKALVDASWRIEALGTLLWALRGIEAMPPYDTRFWPDVVLDPLEILTPTIDLIWCARLRPPDQIHAARDLAELWHWRSQTTQIRINGIDPPSGWTFAEIIQAAAERAFHQGTMPAPIDGDFPVSGKPYADISEDEYLRVTSIAIERHFALNWLCSYAEDWDNIPTET